MNMNIVYTPNRVLCALMSWCALSIWLIAPVLYVTIDIRGRMGENEKPVIWVHGEVKSPPFSEAACKEVSDLLHDLQDGQLLGLPQSRPMPSIGPHCHELRIPDVNKTWRVIYSIHPHAIFVLDVFPKTTRQTPKRVIDNCRKRLRRIEQSEWRAKNG